MRKQFKTKALRRYRTGYPGRHDDVQVDALLRGSLLQQFRPWTLLAAGSLGLLPASLLGVAVAGEEEPLGKSSQEITAEVAAVRKFFMASIDVLDNSNYVPGQEKEISFLSSNPKVKAWHKAELNEGRVFLKGDIAFPAPKLQPDSKEQDLFQAVAGDLFRAYGLQPKENVQITIESDSNDGAAAEFEADLYDETAKVGLEISSDHQLEFLTCYPAEQTEDMRKVLLETEEHAVLNEEIESGGQQFYVNELEDHWNTLDPEERLRCFMDSVVNYLDWLKAEGKI